jgi:glycosyltransferase involved in cell wall biosynthesis
MPALFALANVLLVHLVRDPLYELTVPSKTYTYLAAGKAILMGVSGDGARLIEETGAGLTCPPEDPAAMAAAVLRLRAMPPAELGRFGAAGRAAFERDYRQELLLDRYEALLRDVAASRGRSRSLDARGQREEVYS